MKEKVKEILQEKLRDAESKTRLKEAQLFEMDSKLNSMLQETEEKQAKFFCLMDEIKEMEELS